MTIEKFLSTQVEQLNRRERERGKRRQEKSERGAGARVVFHITTTTTTTRLDSWQVSTINCLISSDDEVLKSQREKSPLAKM